MVGAWCPGKAPETVRKFSGADRKDRNERRVSGRSKAVNALKMREASNASENNGKQ
jgi:hypothetical protein